MTYSNKEEVNYAKMKNIRIFSFLDKPMDEFVSSAFKSQHDKVKYPDTHYHHVTKTTFSIAHDEAKFWFLYCESVLRGVNTFISELVPSKTTPVQYGYTINLDFDTTHVSKRPDDVKDLIEGIHQYVKQVIGNTQSLIRLYFGQSQQQLENIASYFTRPDDYILNWTNKYVQFRAKVVFPFFKIQANYVEPFHKFLISHLQVHHESIQHFLSYTPVNNLTSAIIPLSTDYNILYGASESMDMLPLLLRKCYGIIDQVSGEGDELQWEKFFSPTYHRVVQSGIISMQTLASIASQQSWLFWLPLLFSIENNIPTMQPQGKLTFVDEQPVNITMKIIRDSGNNESIHKLDRARAFLMMVNETRVSQFWSWFDIGSALHSIDSGKEGLDLFKWVTGQGNFKDGDDCEEIWYTLNDAEGVTGETLEYFASCDNRTRYDTFVEREVNDAINKAIYEQEDIPIAKAFKACYPFDFVCSNYDSGVWYYYQNHRWNSDDGVAMIMTYITDKFVPKLERMLADVTSKFANSKDKLVKGTNDSLKDGISSLLKKLNKTDFNMKICRALRQQYHKRCFNKFADLRASFTACPNGVIDLRGGKKQFRPGKPEDFITKVAGCCYPETYTWNTKIVKDTMEYISKVFRSESLRSYVLKLLGSLLYSGNNDKIFPILVGDGDNSKSIFVRLIEAALGSYAVKLPYTLFTEKKAEADKPTPLLIHSRGAKVAFLQEPNKSQPIQSGTVKEFTGHDTMPVRDLFDKGSKMIDMEITVVPFLITNKIPEIPDCQRAIWERTKVIEFSSQWIKGITLSTEQQFIQGKFLMENKFDTKIGEMAPAMLWIMAEKYEEYEIGQLMEPDEVIKATEHFRVSNNKFIQFSTSGIVPALNEFGQVDMTVAMSLDELYDRYKRWYKSQEYKERIEPKSNFKELVESVWRQKADGDDRWYGVKFKIAAANVFGSGGGSLLL
jgi:P4 family phage/plasmid primase-like protien